MERFRPTVIAASIAALAALSSAPAAAERSASYPWFDAPSATPSAAPASRAPAAPRDPRSSHLRIDPPKIDPPKPAPNPLFLECAGCTPREARVDVRPAGSGADAKDSYYTYTLENAYVSSVRGHGSSDYPMETMSFTYSKTTDKTDPEPWSEHMRPGGTAPDERTERRSADPAPAGTPYRGVIHDRSGRPVIEITAIVDQYGVLRNTQYKLIESPGGATSGPEAPRVSRELAQSFERAAWTLRDSLVRFSGGVHVAAGDLNGDGAFPLAVSADGARLIYTFDPKRTFGASHWARVASPTTDGSVILPRIGWETVIVDTWIDASAPVATAKDGRKYKLLFAPIVVDAEFLLTLGPSPAALRRADAEPARTSAALERPSASWAYLMLPYIEQDNLYRAWTPPARSSGARGDDAPAAVGRATGVQGWLVHLDRELVSPIELLGVAEYRQGLLTATFRPFLERPAAPAGWEVFARPGAPGVEAFGTAKRGQAEPGTIAAVPALPMPRGVDAHLPGSMPGVSTTHAGALGPVGSALQGARTPALGGVSPAIDPTPITPHPAVAGPQGSLFRNIGAAVLGPELLRGGQPPQATPLHR